MANIREIARKTNVSIATVSRALNNHPEINAETRQKVLRVANEEGYFATAGKNGTNVLGLVFTVGDIYWSAYDSAVLAGVIRGVAEDKFDVTIVNLLRDKDPSETFTQFFTRKRLRGIIMRTTSEYRSLCQQIADEGFPMIVVAERFEGTNVNFVGYDSRPDSRRAIEHLIHLGHRRIALCGQLQRDRDHQDRVEGYRDALSANGIPFDEELVIHSAPAGVNGNGVSAIKRLMSLPLPPTAVYFTDPPTAIDAIRRTQEMNIRIPDDLSVVGFDDEDMRHQVYPSLTAVCQSAFNEGFEAAIWLSRRLNGNAPERCQKVFNTFFEVNQTTGIVPKTPIRILPDGSRLPVETSAAVERVQS